MKAAVTMGTEGVLVAVMEAYVVIEAEAEAGMEDEVAMGAGISQSPSRFRRAATDMLTGVNCRRHGNESASSSFAWQL